MRIFIVILSCFVLTQAGYAKRDLNESLPVYKKLENALKDTLKVKQLVLRGKKYKKVPAQVFLMKNLEYLDLSRNQLKSLPIELKSLKHLKVLRLDKNQLSTFPEIIYEMPELEILVISDNDFSVLSPAIKGLVNLKKLDLYRTNVYLVPKEMGQMKSLTWVDFRGISLNRKQQEGIKAIILQAKLYFSPPCNCNL